MRGLRTYSVRMKFSLRHPLPILCTMALLPACCPLHTVRVTADPTMANASVRVDVAPASPALSAVSVGDYWVPGNPTRQGASGVKTVQFGPGHQATQSVSVSPGRAKQVVVIADLPGSHSNAPGEADPRRKLLPACGKGAKSEAQVQVSAAGLYVVPAAR
jgi:hypothetical protein